MHLPGIGSLTVKVVPPKKNARNLHTGELVDIPARRKIKFTVAAAMKERLAVLPPAHGEAAHAGEGE